MANRTSQRPLQSIPSVVDNRDSINVVVDAFHPARHACVITENGEQRFVHTLNSNIPPVQFVRTLPICHACICSPVVPNMPFIVSSYKLCFVTVVSDATQYSMPSATVTAQKSEMMSLRIESAALRPNCDGSAGVGFARRAPVNFGSPRTPPTQRGIFAAEIVRRAIDMLRRDAVQEAPRIWSDRDVVSCRGSLSRKDEIRSGLCKRLVTVF